MQAHYNLHSNFFTDVTVSVPSKLNVSEGDGSVQICVTLVALESTERDFSITVATSDDTGTCRHTWILFPL